MSPVSDQQSAELASLTVTLSGRETLWGKTKEMFLQTEQLATSYDWVLKADDDTFIFMENLKSMLSHFNSSSALMAGALWRCRGNGDCQDWKDKSQAEQIFMSGGAGYVLSWEAVRQAGLSLVEDCRDTVL